jgi:hypothetical protein
MPNPSVQASLQPSGGLESYANLWFCLTATLISVPSRPHFQAVPRTPANTSTEDDPLAVELRGGLLMDHTVRQ